MSSPTVPQMRYDRKSRPPQRRLALAAVVTWPIILALGWDRVVLGDELRLLVSLMLYIAAAFERRGGWVPFTVIAGPVLGLMSDPGGKGGSSDGQMWETVRHLAGGMAIGFWVGLALDSIPRTRNYLRDHMR